MFNVRTRVHFIRVYAVQVFRRVRDSDGKTTTILLDDVTTDTHVHLCIVRRYSKTVRSRGDGHGFGVGGRAYGIRATISWQQASPPRTGGAVRVRGVGAARRHIFTYARSIVIVKYQMSQQQPRRLSFLLYFFFSVSTRRPIR